MSWQCCKNRLHFYFCFDTLISIFNYHLPTNFFNISLFFFFFLTSPYSLLFLQFIILYFYLYFISSTCLLTESYLISNFKMQVLSHYLWSVITWATLVDYCIWYHILFLDTISWVSHHVSYSGLIIVFDIIFCF